MHVGTLPLTPAEAVKGPHTLRLHLISGATVDVPLLPVEIGDAESQDLRSFSVTIPSPGQVVSAEVLYRGKALTVRDASGAKLHAHRQARPGTRTVHRAVVVSGGHLTVTWDPASEPYLSVLHVSPTGIRTVIAHRLTGGTASIDVSGFLDNGLFEVSTSSEFAGTLTKINAVD